MWTQRLGSSSRALELAEVFQPAVTFLGLNGDTGRVDLALERRGAFELVTGPELHCGEPQRHAPHRHRQTGMHEQSADRMLAKSARLVLAAIDALGDADQLGPLSLIGKLG